ncbi:MAG: S-adenosyl-l-methionine hydroxide adenosyltransferase family protein [Thermoplasmatales archaeon]|nr:MAG: S-adenosyl-l-methionine hydroxide adenosyltransferase family protein [Thermoplasmatales archaeon]
MKLITMLSDFGSKSNYVSQMKGIALSMSEVSIVDITHDITPYNIREGAYVLKTCVPYFPVGTVHIGIVDPGVGSDRRGIVIVTNTHILVGPDNGLLIPAANELGNFTVYEIKNPRLMLKNVSNTFHGRDIFTPIAAHILNGVYFEEIGPIIGDFINLNFGKSEITSKTATGEVIYVDNFGNVITNIDGNKLRNIMDYDKKIMLHIRKKQKKMSFVKTYGSVKPGDFLATIGSNNLLEISINQGDASKKLDVKPGEKIKILLS